MSPHHTIRRLLPLTCVWVASCAPAPNYDVQENKALLQPISAQHLRVIPAFTQPKNMDGDPIPETLEVVVQAFDQAGEPIKLAGQLTFELYSHRQPAPDPKGQLIQNWQKQLTNPQEQEMYWDRKIRMYKFPLLISTPQQLPQQSKFVILVRCTNPWNEHLENQAEIDLSKMIAHLKSNIQGATEKQ